VVTKTRAAAVASTWDYRLQVINGTFNAIGAKNVEKIMGNRFVDVCKAMKGEAAFRLDEPVVQRQEQNVSGSASMLTSNRTTNRTNSVIGEKRKHEPEVIELSD